MPPSELASGSRSGTPGSDTKGRPCLVAQFASLRDESNRRRVASLLRHSADGDVFVTPAYLAAVRDVLGIETTLCVVVGRDDEWLAAVPVFHRRRFGLERAVMPGLTPYASVLLAERVRASTAMTLDCSNAIACAIAARFRDARQHLMPSFSDVRGWQWAGWDATPAYTYVLDLIAPRSFSHSVRKHVRKCTEGGFTANGDWDVERGWPAIEATIKRQGVGIGMSRGDFCRLADSLHSAGLAYMTTALAPDGIAAAVRVQLAIPGAACAYDWAAGTRTPYLASGVSAWLVTQTIERSAALGFKRWDMCGAQFASVARFKSEFGGSLVHGFTVAAPQHLASHAAARVRRSLAPAARWLRQRGLRR